MARCLLRDGVSKIIELVGVSPESWGDGPKPPVDHARKALYLLTFEKSLLNLGHPWQVTPAPMRASVPCRKRGSPEAPAAVSSWLVGNRTRGRLLTP